MDSMLPKSGRKFPEIGEETGEETGAETGQGTGEETGRSRRQLRYLEISAGPALGAPLAPGN